MPTCLTLLYCWHLKSIQITVNAQLQEGHCGAKTLKEAMQYNKAVKKLPDMAISEVHTV